MGSLDPEIAALQVLDYVGWGGVPPVNLSEIFPIYGIEWYFADIPIPALTTYLDGAITIVVSRRLPRTAQRFRAAHEFGHIVLHQDYIRGWLPVTRAQEREASRFAGAILCPITSFARDYQLRETGVLPSVAVLGAYNVGPSVASYRFTLPAYQ